MSKDFKLRSVNTKFWDDNYITDLDPIEKLLFLYFLTNPLTNLAGIYEISLRRIAFDTGIDKDMVSKILERFESDNKVYYRESYIILANFYKNQNYNPSMLLNAEKYIKSLPKSIISFVSRLEGQPVASLIPTYAQVEGEGEGEGEDKGEGEKEDGQAEAEKIFRKKWSRNYKTLPELMEACNLIKEYGLAKVENAFHVAAIRDKMTLPYVKGILLDKPKDNYGTYKQKPPRGSIDINKYREEAATVKRRDS